MKILISALVLRNKMIGKKIKKTATCWLYTGAVTKNGYVNLTVNKKQILGHRYFYLKFVGKIPKGMCVCHKCDIRNCLNPEHLFLGTQKDNVQDMIKKGRQVVFGLKGEKNANSKLSEKQVLEIRKLWENNCHCSSKLARQFNVNRVTIIRIITRDNWKHI